MCTLSCVYQYIESYSFAIIIQKLLFWAELHIKSIGQWLLNLSLIIRYPYYGLVFPAFNVAHWKAGGPDTWNHVYMVHNVTWAEATSAHFKLHVFWLLGCYWLAYKSYNTIDFLSIYLYLAHLVPTICGWCTLCFCVPVHPAFQCANLEKLGMGLGTGLPISCKDGLYRSWSLYMFKLCRNLVMKLLCWVDIALVAWLWGAILKWVLYVVYIGQTAWRWDEKWVNCTTNNTMCTCVLVLVFSPLVPAYISLPYIV